MSYRRTQTAGVGHSGRWALGGKMAINPFAQRLCLIRYALAITPYGQKPIHTLWTVL